MKNNNDLYVFKDDEKAELIKQRMEFVAIDLVLPVLKSIKAPRPWAKVEELAIYEYERNRDWFLDADVEGLLSSKRGDKWIKKGIVAGYLAKKRIELILNEAGWYIARPQGEGIWLTTEPEEIKADRKKMQKQIITRSKNLSKSAIRVKRTMDVDLPIVITQVRAIEAEISNEENDF